MLPGGSARLTWGPVGFRQWAGARPVGVSVNTPDFHSGDDGFDSRTGHMAWIYVELKAEGYFQVPEGMDGRDYALAVMESDDWDKAGLGSEWMGRLLNEGIVGVSATVAPKERAQGFLDTIATLKKPFDPEDYVTAERPKRHDGRETVQADPR